MTRGDELRALAKRVMALAGPCRETDAEIALACGIVRERDGNCLYGHRYYSVLVLERGYYDHGNVTELAAYTASIDAALSLVPDLAVTSLAKQERWRSPAWTWGLNDKRAVTHFATAATPALALCAAALLARAQEETKP